MYKTKNLSDILSSKYYKHQPVFLLVFVIVYMFLSSMTIRQVLVLQALG